VGAGPGDPDLLTRRAVDRLASADLVVYDALVDPRVLDFAPSARRLFAGKRAGRPSVTQAFINRALIRAARRGLRVVRLKGGDPFVFGRGGEEALALATAGVPFEIVPGISSAIAAPASCGIPVTHRGLASAVVVVSGHAEEAYGDVLRSLTPTAATIVVLMGRERLEAIAALLLERGWPPATPVAVVEGAWTPEQAEWTATLATAGRMVGTDHGGPATIVIGKVVDIGAQIATSHPQRQRLWQSHGLTATP
jgi:uroporphyrin-III C-methyltransferase/precorrin-2 dehydrogenase/sirohydrochlorin ferrochelatase